MQLPWRAWPFVEDEVTTDKVEAAIARSTRRYIRTLLVVYGGLYALGFVMAALIVTRYG